MAIQEIQENDYIKDSRAVINNNFTELDTLKAPLASPAFTGTPTAPTPTASDDSTKIATTEFVHDNTDDKLPLTGGTLTDNLTISKNRYPSLITKSTGIERSVAPASVYEGLPFFSSDKNSNRFWGLFHTYGTDRSNKIELLAYSGLTTDYTFATIGVGFDGGGHVFTYAPTPANGDNSTKIATTAFVHNNYLPLSGGTINGTVKFSTDNALSRNTTDGEFIIYGGEANFNSPCIALRGQENATDAGALYVRTKNTTQSTSLLAKPDGTFTWGGQPIQTSSDKRLKQDFADVPNDVLEAWGKVNWQQFKYKDDVKRKGDSCRFHTGLVAQDVKEVGEENNVDLLKYGILCHDVREAVEEEKDEDGNVIREASEAVDLWTVRYEEALAMEAAYQRRRSDRLEERIEALEKLLMNRTE